MRYLPILILVVFCGCTGTPHSPPSSTEAIEGRYPVVAGEIAVTIGEGREMVPPPRGAAAGSRWIEHAVTYANKSDRPIWIDKNPHMHLYSEIETRTNESGEWRSYGLGYCGAGVRAIEIAPGASLTFTAALPEEYVGQDFRVMLQYRMERDSQQWVQAVSQARRIGRPAAG